MKRRHGGLAEQTVEISEIGAGGAGVGRLADGRVAFVHGTAPGDQAVVEPVDVRKDWARARLVRVLRPGPARRAAPCPHFGRCGGCTLQHLRYESQLEAKAGIVRRALRHVANGGLPPAVEPSPLELGYRNRVSLSLLRLGSGRVVAGFHELGNPGRVVDVEDDCLLPEPAVAGAWSVLRRAWGRNAERLPAGRRLRLTVRATESGEVALVIERGYGRGRPEELLEQVPGLVAVWHRPGSGEVRLLAGRSALAECWNREETEIAGASFLQVNRSAAARLEAWVAERVAPGPGMRIVDAYCGIGLRARRLALGGATVTGIELDPAAVEQARKTDGAARWLEGRVEDRLAEALPADVLIVNPPRTGLAAAVTELVASRPPRRLVYVSCDAATLARDLGRLQGALHVSALRCFDLFPQTAHVETVVELACATT